MNYGQALRRFALALPFLLTGCGSDDQTTGLLNGGTVAKLSIVGPDEVESGTFQIEAGSLVPGFVAKLQSASGQPVPNRFVAIKLTPVLGSINAPPSKASTNGDKTDTKGVVDFSYQAPDEVAAATDVTLTGSTTLADGTKLTAEYSLTLVPAPPPVVTITGPINVGPGVSNTGFRVTVSRKNGEQIPSACVTVNTTGGVISPAPTTSCDDGSPGNLTDEAGVFVFTVTPVATIAKDTPLTITASTTVSGKTVTKSFVTTVRADTFQFTSPLPGTPIVVGGDNAQPLHFQWTRSPQTQGGAQGVSGQLTLLISGGGRLVLNGDPFNESQSIVVNTDASSGGDFTRPVAVSSNNSGQATITAREDGTGGRTATLVVQFVDSPGEINLDATPLVVPTTSGRSNLVVTVLNQVGSPITGVDVVFLLTSSAGGSGERVTPQRQTTDANGQAKSQYYAGTAAGTARVQVRVQGGSLSNTSEITVEAPVPPVVVTTTATP